MWTRKLWYFKRKYFCSDYLSINFCSHASNLARLSRWIGRSMAPARIALASIILERPKINLREHLAQPQSIWSETGKTPLDLRESFLTDSRFLNHQALLSHKVINLFIFIYIFLHINFILWFIILSRSANKSPNKSSPSKRDGANYRPGRTSSSRLRRDDFLR